MGKKWPIPMNLPFFAVEAYVPGGGGVQNQAEKIRKMPSGRYQNKFFQWKGVVQEGGGSFFTLETSEVSKRGWRTEGVGARKSLPWHKFRPFFCTLFPVPPL